MVRQVTARHRKAPQDTARHRKTSQDTARDLKCNVIIDIQSLRVITTVNCWGMVGLMTSQNIFGKFFFSQFVQKCYKKCSPLFRLFCQTWSDMVTSRVFITVEGGGSTETLERDRIRPQRNLTSSHLPHALQHGNLVS